MADTFEGSASPVPDDEAPALQPIPPWVTDPDGSFPVGYERNDEGTRHRLILGNKHERRAVVISPRGPFQIPGEELVGLAAGAYKAVAERDCTRQEAEIIAKGWMVVCRRALN